MTTQELTWEGIIRDINLEGAKLEVIGYRGIHTTFGQINEISLYEDLLGKYGGELETHCMIRLTEIRSKPWNGDWKEVSEAYNFHFHPTFTRLSRESNDILIDYVGCQMIIHLAPAA